MIRSYRCRLAQTATWVLLMAATLACGASLESSRQRLRKAYVGYNDAVRWSAWSAAARWVPPNQRSQFLRQHGDPKRVDPIAIADYAVRQVDYRVEDLARALIVVEVSWYRLPDVTLRKSLRYQTWQKAGGVWHITDETPNDPRDTGARPPPEPGVDDAPQ